jgi:hypothetical protein
MLACLTGQPRGLSVVEFGSILQRPRGWYRRHTTPVTIDGAHARRWDAGTVDGSHEVQLVFPLRGISVTVLSPHRSLLRRILASVRMVRVNQYGCPTRPHPEYRHGPRPSGPFVPHRAVGMIGCSYRGRWLDRSNRIGPGAAARLIRAFDAAPYGFSRAPRGSILPSICGSSWRGFFVVARFDYAARPPVSVTARISRAAHTSARATVAGRCGWRPAGSFSSRATRATPGTSSIRARRVSARGSRPRSPPASGRSCRARSPYAASSRRTRRSDARRSSRRHSPCPRVPPLLRPPRPATEGAR